MFEWKSSTGFPYAFYSLLCHFTLYCVILLSIVSLMKTKGIFVILNRYVKLCKGRKIVFKKQDDKSTWNKISEKFSDGIQMQFEDSHCSLVALFLAIRRGFYIGHSFYRNRRKLLRTYSSTISVYGYIAVRIPCQCRWYIIWLFLLPEPEIQKIFLDSSREK